MHIEQSKNSKVLAQLIQGTHDTFHEKYPHYFKPYTIDAAEAYFKKQLENERNEFYVLYDLYDGNEMTGFIWSHVEIKEETPLTEMTITLKIQKVVVHPNHRNRGYGQQLIEFVNQLAKRKGCHFIEVDLWYIDDDVVEFLRNQGYELHRGIVWKEV